MASIDIIITQSGVSGVPGESREDLVVGSPVELSNHFNVGITSYKWELVGKPYTSSVTLSSTSSSVVYFTPDVVGSYLIQLTINNKLKQSVVAAILTSRHGIRIPASGEGEEIPGGSFKAITESIRTLESDSLSAAMIQGKSISLNEPDLNDLLRYNGEEWIPSGKVRSDDLGFRNTQNILVKIPLSSAIQANPYWEYNAEVGVIKPCWKTISSGGELPILDFLWNSFPHGSVLKKVYVIASCKNPSSNQLTIRVEKNGAIWSSDHITSFVDQFVSTTPHTVSSNTGVTLAVSENTEFTHGNSNDSVVASEELKIRLTADGTNIFRVFSVYAHFQTLSVGLYNGPLVAEGGGGGGQDDPGSGGDGYWSRDSVGGYLIPKTITDTIMIGNGDSSHPSVEFGDTSSGLYYDAEVSRINIGIDGNLKAYFDENGLVINGMVNGSLGSEIITLAADRNMSGPNNWSGINWVVAGGVYSHTAGENTATLNDYNAEITNTYVVVLTVVTNVVGALSIYYGGAFSSVVGHEVGTLTDYTVVLTATSNDRLIIAPNSTWVGSITNVSIRLVTSGSSSLNIKNADGVVGIEARSVNSTSFGIGPGALKLCISGVNNTALGMNALCNNILGYDNTASGMCSLCNNTNGYFNTASGVYTLYKNTTGSSNTANGSNALYYNTTGSGNTATGHESLYKNTTGSSNTANGFSALYNNTTGSSNTASGMYALCNNTTGFLNTANGVYSLFRNTSGYYNTTSGIYSLFSNTTGINNTASGASALSDNTTGGNNTAFGFCSLYSNTDKSNCIALGYYAGYYSNSSGKLYIDAFDRINTSGDDAGAIITGTMSATPANQILKFNANTTVTNTFTATGGVIVGLDASPNIAGNIKLFSAGVNNYYTTFTAGEQTANATYTLPLAPPTVNGQVLSSTTLGVMSWVTSTSSDPVTLSQSAITGGLSLNVQEISFRAATTSLDGYLKHADWNTFYNKEPAQTKGTISSNTSSVISISNGSSSTVGPNVAITINKASASSDGYLGKDNWIIFNSKEPAQSKGSISETASSVLTITNGSNSTVGPNVTIQAKKASASQDGYLGKNDFIAFSSGGHNPVTLAQSAITGGLSLNVQEILFRAADTNYDGYLKSSDWDIFSGKEPAVTKGNLTESSSSILVFGGTTTNNVIGSGTTIQVKKASALQDGYLGKDDFATFAAGGGGGDGYWSRDSIDGYLKPKTITDTIMVGYGDLTHPAIEFGDTSSGLYYNNGNKRISIGVDANEKAYFDSYGLNFLGSNSVSNCSAADNIDVDAGMEMVDSFIPTDDGACVWHYFVGNGINIRGGTITCAWDLSEEDVVFSEVSTPSLGDTSGLTFSLVFSGGSLNLNATVSSNNWKVKVFRIKIQ